MPLSDKIRLDAGRPFIKTLMARIYVALVLLALVAIVTHKPINMNKYDLYFGKNETPIGTVESIQSVSIPTTSNPVMLAKNDSYGR